MDKDTRRMFGHWLGLAFVSAAIWYAVIRFLISL